MGRKALTTDQFITITSMPYAYEVVSEIKGEASFIWDLEKKEKAKLKDFSYQPKIEFGGSKTECFLKYKIYE